VRHSVWLRCGTHLVWQRWGTRC